MIIDSLDKQQTRYHSIRRVFWGNPAFLLFGLGRNVQSQSSFAMFVVASSCMHVSCRAFPSPYGDAGCISIRTVSPLTMQ